MRAMLRERSRWLAAGLAAVVVLAVVGVQLFGGGEDAATRSATEVASSPTEAPSAEVAQPTVVPIIGSLDADVTFEEPRAVSGVFGWSGGVLETTGSDGSSYHLVIPEGALVGEFEITITPVASVDGTPMDETLAAGVHLAPSNLTFLKSLTLEVSSPGIFPTDAFGFGFSGGGEDFHSQRTRFDGATASTELWHFSGWGAGSGLENLDALQAYTPTHEEEALFRSLRNALNAALACGDAGECPLPNVSPQLVAAWPFVKADLLNAIEDPHQVSLQFQGSPLAAPSALPKATLAISKTSEWLRDTADIQFVAGSPLQVAVDEAFVLLDQLAKKARRTAYQLCTGQPFGTASLEASLHAQVRYVLDWDGVPRAFDQTFQQDPQEQLESCAGVVIASAEVPSYLDDGASGEVKYQVGVRFNGTGGTTRYDLRAATEALAPTMMVSATGGAVASANGGVPGPLYGVDESGWVLLEATKGPDDQLELAAEAQWQPCCALTLNAEREDVIQPSRNLSLLARPESGGAFSETISVETKAQATIQATVLFEASPESGKTVSFTINGPGMLGLSEGMTGSDGIVAVTFTAPDEPGQSTITATHTTATGKVLDDEVIVTYTVTGDGSVTINPIEAVVNSGGTVEFTATTTDLDPNSVIWTSPDGGSVQSTGDLTATWTAPAGEGTYTVIAKAVANSGVVAAAVVTVELAEEAAGTFSEGFFYGRRQDRCEVNPHEGEQCREVLLNTYPAWMQIHEVDGRVVVDFYHGAVSACGWTGQLSFPGKGVVRDIAELTVFPGGAWLENRCPAYPHLEYRARFMHYIQLELGSVGSTSTITARGGQSWSWNALCYSSCLSSSGPYSGSGGAFRNAGEIRFGTNTVTLIADVANPDQQIRWVFVKRPEQDPFGVWGFHPDSLETPEEYRR